MRYLPAIIFMLIAVAFAAIIAIRPGQSPLPSAMLGQPLPAFGLPAIDASAPLESVALRGQVTIINIFASWCVPCRAEHPFIQALAQEPGIRVIGIGWRDTPQNIARWLEEHGNPYAQTAADPEGSLTTSLGITGVPETYIISKDGRIAYKYPGPLDTQLMQETILPLIRNLNHAP